MIYVLCNCNGLFNLPAVIALCFYTGAVYLLFITIYYLLICKMYAPCIMKEINNIYSHYNVLLLSLNRSMVIVDSDLDV